MSRLHLAGIIPLANLKTDFQLAIPEVLLPIGPGFSAIQKSVFECAMAGCNTIWIVANDDLAPIIREIVGDWVYDPVYYHSPAKFSSEQRKEIPIYYVPIHPKDRDRRDSYGWSVLYGIHCAWRVAHNISQWITPDKYYISFPLSTFDVYQVRTWRRAISDPKKNFFFTHKKSHIKNNLPISFTMTGEDFKLCRRTINKKTTREYLPPSPDQQYPSQKLPLQNRWSARYFTLQDVFEAVEDKNAHKVELDWHYNISDWGGYRNFLSSEHVINTPEEYLTKPHTHVKLPYTSEE
jgi:hypothetical protein|tara:strand:- start:272 stop:1150 length:879 start_codon:yes stop_codon:yes gene_type:complete